MTIDISVSGTELDASHSIDVLIGLAQSCGARAVELWYPKNLEHDGRDASIRKLMDSGLAVSSVSTPSTLYGADPQAATRLLRSALVIAGEVGARFVNTYFGHSLTVDDERAGARYARLIAPLVEQARARGVVITLENEFDAFGWDPLGSDITRRPAALSRLFSILDSENFKLNFDAANFLCAGECPREVFAQLNHHVAYMHAKDVIAVRKPVSAPEPGWTRYSDHGRLFDTVRLGEGEVGWRGLLDLASRCGYRGYVTLEPHCSLDLLSTELQHAAGFVRTACPC